MKNSKNNTTKIWDLEFYENDIHFEFAEDVDLCKMYDVLRKAVEGNEEWSTVLESRIGDSFSFNYSVYEDDFANAIPVICKAIAEAFPSVCFSGGACHNSLKCYFVDIIEFSFDGSTIRQKETIYDDDSGYFCPECGYMVAYADEVIDDDEIECDDCEEVIKVSDLKYAPPFVKETIITIK